MPEIPLTDTLEERERERNFSQYKLSKQEELKKRLDDGIIIRNNYDALNELLDNCKTKKQVDLVFQ
jgi:hypothetical protein